MEIIRGTTPTIEVTLENGTRFEKLGKVILRIKQGTLSIDKEPTSYSANKGIFTYTEEETIKLQEGKAEVQLVGIDGNLEKIVSKTYCYEITILKSLWNEVVKYE